MRAIIFTIFGMALFANALPASAQGLTAAGELEHARANARAGGPVSGRDAELLERYGCLSGTRSAFCRRIEHRHAYRGYSRRLHHHRRRHR
jgi:hypothetical protein